MLARNLITIIVALLILLLTDPAVSATQQRAITKFESALNACDRGMQMKMPKSRGSLRILKTLLKRYRRNRDAALNIDKTVKDSGTEYYTGNFFVEQTAFEEAYHTCENDFVDKVKMAEDLIAQKIEARKAKREERLARRQMMKEKSTSAQRQVFLAVNEYCAHYLRDPKIPLSPLYKKYETAKQKALELYPNIVQQVHQAMIYDAASGEEKNISKTVSAWFEDCESAFLRQGAIGPIPPNTSMSQIIQDNSKSIKQIPPAITTIDSPKEKPSESIQEIDSSHEKKEAIQEDKVAVEENELAEEENEIQDEEDYRKEMEAEYQSVMKTMSADRLNILKKEGRVPDYVDDEDGHYKKSKIWQYEAEDESQCSTYHFKGNKLTQSKTLKGVCPPF